MKRLFLCFAAGIFAAAPAEAVVSFSFAGTFKPSDGASFRTLLGGGSYEGSFTLAGTSFPTGGTTSFQSYSLVLRDSTGVEKLRLTGGQNGASGYIGTSYTEIYGGTRIYFYNLATSQDYLQLVVPTGFTGTGAVLANGYSYAQVVSGGVNNQATVASGVVTRMPEPAAWATMTLGFGMVGLGLRRRRRAAPAA